MGGITAAGIGQGLTNLGNFLTTASLQSMRDQSEMDKVRLAAQLATQGQIEAHAANLEANTANINAQREASVARVNDAQQGLISAAQDKQVNDLYGPDSNLTHSDISDEERAAFPVDDRTKRDLRTQAAIQTGDISPERAMTDNTKADIAMLTIQQRLDKADTMTEIAKIGAESREYGYQLRLQAAQEKAANGKIDTATGRMLITSYDADIRASTSMLNMVNQQLINNPPKDKGELAGLKAQAEQYKAEIKAAQANKVGFFKSMGYPAGEYPTNTPTVPAPGATPAKPFNPADFQK